jgi:predicted nuclease of predicted toxin-antitoxin system
MRFLANENVPGVVVRALEIEGHDITWVRTAAPGSTDEFILAWAEREARVLLTFDQDFGELAWRAGLPASCGIVLLRIPPVASATAGAALARRLSERSDWIGHFSVVQPGRIRMRRLQQVKEGEPRT